MDSASSAPGVVERYAAAWLAGDLTTLIDCYDENIVAHYGGRSEYAGTHVGRDRLLHVLLETGVKGDRQLLSVDQTHDDGDVGAIFTTERYVVDGEPHEVLRALRYRIAEDRLIECWLFDHDQHIVDAAWSQPDR